MKIIRALIYEGDKKWVLETLARSLPPGITTFGNRKRSISVIALNSREEFDLNVSSRQFEIEKERSTDEEADRTYDEPL